MLLTRLITAALLAILSLGASAQCTQVQLNFNSNMQLQGPSFVQWYASVYQGNTFNQGVCQFSPNDPECSATLCLETGCYTFLVTSIATIAPWEVGFSINVTVGGQTVTQQLQSYNTGNNQYSFTIGVNTDCVACDMNVSTIQNLENVLVLQASNFAPGAQIHWTQNGQQVNVGPITTFLLQPGANEICASYETPDCPQGVFWCETFVYQPFPDCLATVLVHPLTCNSYAFDFAGNDVQADVIWNFGDGQFGEGLSVTHIFEENGIYVITATYTGIDCPEPVVQQVTVEVTCDGGPECPTSMVYEQTSCGHYTFSIPGASAQSTVFWNINNNLVTNNGQPISMEFAPGTYQGYAIYQAVGCAPTTFVVNFTVAPCNPVCPSEIVVSDVNGCGTYAFALIDFPQFGDISWTWGDGGSNTGANGAFHSYPTPGTYEVCVAASTDACPQGVEICIPLVVEGCNLECPTGIEVVPMGCGLYGFEVGSAATVTAAVWNFGDGTTETGGHYITHQFTEPGVYVVQVNAGLTIPCFNNFFVVTIVVEECEEECNQVNIALTPTGNPSSWWLSNENGEAIYETNCEGSLCMTQLCLPDGCYTLYHVPNIGGDNVFEVFSQTVDVSIELLYVGDATNVYLLSVGQNCSEQCTEVGFVLESNYMMGGPLQAVWSLSETNLEGFASLTPNTPVYTWNECLPDGCYTLTVIGQNMQNPAAFSIDLTGGWEVVSENMVQDGGQFFYTFELALNSDCGQEPDCFEGGFFIDSFMNMGGPHEATWVITSDGDNWGQGETGFSVEDPYFDFNGCLPTGCYVLHVTGYGNDNSEAFSAGMVGDWVSQALEIVENGNQIHYYIQFSVNGGCENGDCSMEIQAQTEDGFFYVFSATENSGVQPMGWILSGNVFIEGPVVENVFSVPGTYEVCAVYEAPGCVLTECLTVVVEDSEDCYLTTLTISAEFSEFELQVLAWYLESEGFELDGELVLTEANSTVSFTACLPADCYSLTFETPGGVLNALAASVMISVNGATISMTDWPENAGNYTIEFGVMEDCGENVGENAQSSALSVFPNPSSGLFNLKTGRQWNGAQARILDMAGREISDFRIQSEITYLSLQDLATGIYLLQLSSATGTETLRLNLVK